jgi:hypothetical protein
MKITPLFLLILLSGCVSETPEANTTPLTLIPEVDPDIFGLVLDESGDLLENVTLTLFPDELAILTDANGTFEFFNVTRDVPVQIEARKEGHRNSSASLQLSRGLAAQVIFTMPRLDSLPPQYFVAEFNGYLACKSTPNAPCPIASEDQYAAYTAFAPESDLSHQQTVAEMFWNPSFGSENLNLKVQQEGQLVFEDNISPGWKLTLDGASSQLTFTVTVAAPGFVLNQQFDLFVTHFYNLPGAADYSIANP